MGESSFLARLYKSERQRRDSAEQKWARLMSDTADGKEPKDAEQVLEATGKTVNDLQAAVDRLIRRRAARAAVDKAKLVPAERERIALRFKEIEAAYEKAISDANEKYSAAVGPLTLRGRELDKIERDGQAAETVLRDTAADYPPETVNEVAELQAQLADAKRRQSSANAAAHKAGQEAYSANSEANAVSGWAKVSEDRRRPLLAKAAEFSAEEERESAAAAEARKEVAELEARLAKLEEQRVLTP